MLQLRKSVSGGIKDSQKMKTSFFDCFYVMPPLKNGGHYNCNEQSSIRASVLVGWIAVREEACLDHF